LEKIVEENSLACNIDKNMNKLCKNYLKNVLIFFELSKFNYLSHLNSFIFFLIIFLIFLNISDILGTFLDIFDIKLYCFNFYFKKLFIKA